MALDEVFLMLGDVMLNIIMPSVIILSVVAEFQVNKLSLMFVGKSWVVYPLVTKISKGAKTLYKQIHQRIVKINQYF
jgi:hypothetical protein